MAFKKFKPKTKTVKLSGKMEGVAKVEFEDFDMKEAELISTGLLPIDYLLGGGFERGDVIEFASESGTGKSTILLQMCKFLVSRDFRVLYLDFEKGVKLGLLKNMGLDKASKESFRVLQPVTYNQLDALTTKAFIPEKGQSKPAYDVLIIDSTVNVTPSKFLDCLIEESGDVGLEARLTKLYLTKYKSILRTWGANIFLINQMRKKIDFVHGTSEHSAGAGAIKYGADIRFRFRQGALLTHEDTEKGVGVKPAPYGHLLNIWAHKNRAQRPNFIIEVPMVYGRGISNIYFLSQLLLNHGVVVQNHAYYQVKKLDGSDVVEVSCQGRRALLRHIRDHYLEYEQYVRDKGLMKIPTDDLKAY